MDRLRFDYGNLISSRVEGGVDPALLDGALAEAFGSAHGVVEQRRASGALGVRWDINRMWGVKASYGILELDTSSRTEDASIDMVTIQAVFRY